MAYVICLLITQKDFETSYCMSAVDLETNGAGTTLGKEDSIKGERFVTFTLYLTDGGNFMSPKGQLKIE